MENKKNPNLNDFYKILMERRNNDNINIIRKDKSKIRPLILDEELVLKEHYKPQDHLERLKLELSYSIHTNPKMLLEFKKTPEEEAKVIGSWHESRLVEIARAEKTYRERLESARKSGAIDSEEYWKAMHNDSFDRLRREANDTYFRLRKS